MLDRSKLNDVIEKYKRDFNKHWKDEKYKWEAVKHFQDNWDIDAENFGEMFKKATDKTFNLLASGYAYPRGMILEFAKADDNAVREMFRRLYDESLDFSERITTFIDAAEKIRVKYDYGTWKQHYQNTNYVSTYLWLMYPDKYYIYKFELYKKCGELLDDTYRPKRNGGIENVIDGYKMYDEICELLKQDTELKQILESALTDSCYSDNNFITLTIDFGFFLARYYTNNENDSYTNDNEIIPYNPITNTWLLPYDPKKWDWLESHDDDIIRLKQDGKTFTIRWLAIPETSSIGDRVFISKIGNQLPNGIIATGYIVSDEYAAANDTSYEFFTYINIEITGFIEPNSPSFITTESINKEFPEFHISSYSEEIPTNVAEWLIKKWNISCKSHTDHSFNEPVIWKISHGTNSTGVSKELRDIFEKRKVVTMNRYTHPLATSKISQGESFMTEIKSGDYFYLCYGGEIVLFGQFLNDSAKLNPEITEQYNDDNWYEREYKLIAESKDRNGYNGIKKWWTPNHNSTCVKVSDNDLFEELILQPYFSLTLEDLQQKNKYESYTKQDFLKEVYMTEEQYTTLTSLLEHKQNIILQGAPGVGKTFTAKRLAYSMMGEKDDSRIEFIQFHQSYSYEDFIMGYRPDSDNGFELKEGVFYRFCEKARKDSSRDYFFIIDEINRGNLIKIFGELLMLIEKDYRKESATLAYRDEKFYVPENLYIIGMMNTADRSLAMIDYALRRRFSFFEMEPGFDSDGFKKYSDSLNSERFKKLIEQIKALNKEIEADTSLGKGFCIGHSYLCNIRPEECTDEKLKMIVEYDIIPMLNEYWFDDKNNREKWSDNLRGIFNDS